MSETRPHAYRDLIQRLLSCPSGAELQVLQDHEELVDSGLLDAMRQVSREHRERGWTRSSEFLDWLAARLTPVVQKTLSRTQDGFVTQLLQTIADTRDPGEVTILLDANPHHLDESLPAAIVQVFIALHDQFSPQQRAYLASATGVLGMSLFNYPRGDQAVALESALVCYRLVLEVITRPFHAELWARYQYGLGLVLRERIRGDRAQNLEDAIGAFRNALEVHTRDSHPEAWAALQTSLGHALRERIRGDRAQNVEDAIRAYRSGLEVKIGEGDPIDRAVSWTGLGHGLRDRVQGDPAANLEEAVAAYRAALEAVARDAHPGLWADIQNSLGLALLARPVGSRTHDPEGAIAAFRAAMEVHSRDAHPAKWAAIQDNLGLALRARIGGDRAENVEAAISAHRAALEVRSRSAAPESWAGTQFNLALALRDRVPGDRADDVQEAVSAIRDSFTVIDPTGFPHKSLWFGRTLGHIARAAGRWEDCVYGFEQAIEGAEQHRRQAVDERRRNEIVADAWDAYAGLINGYLRTGRPARAMETAERSKSRGLVELLSARDLQPKNEVPHPLLAELARLQRQKVLLQRQIEIGERITRGMEDAPSPSGQSSRAAGNDVGPTQAAAREALLATRAALEETLLQISKYDPAFALAQEEVRPLPWEAIRALVPDDHTALLCWYIGPAEFYAFVQVSRTDAPIPIELTGEALRSVVEWLNQYLAAYHTAPQAWAAQLPASLRQLTELLGLASILDAIPAGCDRLLVLPHRFLHLLPLHALPLPGLPELCLLDRFPRGVSYAPSAHLLHLATRRERPRFDALLAWQNPTADLDFAAVEVPAIAAQFAEPAVLVGEAVEASALRLPGRISGAHCLHFACHGAFDLEQPLESSLFLAGGDRLSLAEVFGLDLPRCRLVTLSACETGRIDVRSSGEEYVGLPSGFLYAGSPGIVCSLWTVSDVSTALLMIEFYARLNGQRAAGEPFAVARALTEAQRWLRDSTTAALYGWARERESLGMISRAASESLQCYFSDFPDSARPFEAPFYWGAFSAVGS